MPPPLFQDKFVGINFPWYDYGVDFGGTQPPAWQSDLPDELERLKDLGIYGIRWFLLAAGFFPPQPHTIGTGSSWRVETPAALSTPFLENFRAMLRIVDLADMKVIPTLIDFKYCFNGFDASGRGVKGGRYAHINVFLSDFLDCTLQPLINIIAGETYQVSGSTTQRQYRNAVLAFDLINEPEWCTDVNNPFSWSFRQPNVTFDAMRHYIREGSARLNVAGIRSTVGFADHESPRRGGNGWYERRNPDVTMHQFHVPYGDWRHLGLGVNLSNVPSHTYNPAWPCIIGEVGSRCRIFSNLYSLCNMSLGARVRYLLFAKNYPAVFIWPEPRPNDGLNNRVLPWARLDPPDVESLRIEVTPRLRRPPRVNL